MNVAVCVFHRFFYLLLAELRGKIVFHLKKRKKKQWSLFERNERDEIGIRGYVKELFHVQPRSSIDDREDRLEHIRRYFPEHKQLLKSGILSTQSCELGYG